MLIPTNLRPKYVKGFERLYGTTRTGLVYSFQSWKFIKPNYSTNGYQRVDLFIEGEHYRERVSRLVAKTFIPVPKHLQHISVNELEVDHINNKRDDNRIENLQWITLKDNRRKARNVPVAMDNIPLIFTSQTEAAQWIYGHNNVSCINLHLKGSPKHKTCKGNTLHKCNEQELSILDEFKKW